ncbi:MAG: NAD(P)H-dependent oxidoreductase [Gemmatimonadota bacterium]|nr:NAD(P)H-dependent oxidoreductase [Gemmatimonadota bacterium]MDH5198074.1 NAD(P)H-dependent oxidoreductase [Gemmatimonadota bacterium]
MTPTPSDWHDLGPIEQLRQRSLQQVRVGRTTIALSYRDGTFGAVSGVCNHAGGPLGEGRLDGDFLVCPWHNWKFHRVRGHGEPGFEDDQIPQFALREEGGHLFVRLEPVVSRKKKPHAPHPLARRVERAAGGLRIAGISTTHMDRDNPRYSTSEALLETALQHAEEHAGLETRLLRLDALRFRACEGYYSKSAQACTWPCSITQMDPSDELDQLYETLVFWADVVLVATPIRWGGASARYYRMAERLNCIQNQVTIRDRVLIRNKVAGFIITGGQDNVQAVAGQMLTFFSELGFLFPQFPFIAHSRGWSAEDMENNVAVVRGSGELHDAARELVDRAAAMATLLVGSDICPARIVRAGRKASGTKATA